MQKKFFKTSMLTLGVGLTILGLCAGTGVNADNCQSHANCPNTCVDGHWKINSEGNGYCELCTNNANNCKWGQYTTDLGGTKKWMCGCGGLQSQGSTTRRR